MPDPYQIAPQDPPAPASADVPVGRPVDIATGTPVVSTTPSAATGRATAPVPPVNVLEDARTEVGDFCVPHAPGVKVLVGIGTFLLLIAIIAAGANGSGFWGTIGNMVLAFWEAVVHTGTGVAAVALAAWLVQQKFGNLEFAIARIFVAFCAFLFIMQLRIPPGYVGVALKVLLAGLVYWCLILLLFRKSPRETSMVAVSHAGLWLFVLFGLKLAGWIPGADDPVPTAPPASTVPRGAP